MLTKLLKYEFQATVRTYGTIYFALLAVAGLLGFTFRVDDHITVTGSNAFDVLVTLYSLLVIALVIVTVVTVIQRFTKNLLGREGYLMHTLPVTETQLVASKIISSAVWLLASALVGVVSILVMFCIGADFSKLDVSNFWDDWNALHTSFQSEVLWGLFWMAVLCYARVLCSILCIYLSCMVGHLVPQHSSMVSVISFFVLSWGQGRLENLLDAGGFVRVLMGPAESTVVSAAANQSMAVFFGTSFVVTAVFGAVYFVATTFLMKKKLNLN